MFESRGPVGKGTLAARRLSSAERSPATHTQDQHQSRAGGKPVRQPAAAHPSSLSAPPSLTQDIPDFRYTPAAVRTGPYYSSRRRRIRTRMFMPWPVQANTKQLQDADHACTHALTESQACLRACPVYQAQLPLAHCPNSTRCRPGLGYSGAGAPRFSAKTQSPSARRDLSRRAMPYLRQRQPASSAPRPPAPREARCAAARRRAARHRRSPARPSATPLPPCAAWPLRATGAPASQLAERRAQHAAHTGCCSPPPSAASRALVFPAQPGRLWNYEFTASCHTL